MNDAEFIFAVWGMVAVGVLWFGVMISFIGDTARGRRNGARAALTCWAWPVWVAAFVIYGIGWVLVAFWKTADFNNTAGEVGESK